MSATETALIFVGVPAAITLLITVLVLAPGARGPHRYRPGRPFTFSAVWFLSSPDQLAESATKTALTTGAAPALTGRDLEKAGAPAGTLGGASDRW